MPMPAAVMNMFYTGLGIARSLGPRGVRVIGLSATRIYGNHTRYAEIRRCPDSRDNPAELLQFLLDMAREIGGPCVIFPTRDDDARFLDRYRAELDGRFISVLPSPGALRNCLNKFESYRCAMEAGVAAPKCAIVDNERDLKQVAAGFRLPIVLKPVSAHQWRQAGHWKLVGARKAIAISSAEELVAEYRLISRADPRVLIQEMIPGDDSQLMIAAGYVDRSGNWSAGFTAQKLAQVPAGFGTGCIVQAVNRPELIEPTCRLLKAMNFTGIAEVEYKWDAASRQYQLIEVNPRPWDQHVLGRVSGVDVIHLAYCDHAGLPRPAVAPVRAGTKWIAEDTLVSALLRFAWRRHPQFWRLLRLTRGKRIYGIWSASDPMPSVAYLMVFLPGLIGTVLRRLGSALAGLRRGGSSQDKEQLSYGKH
jgi:D-aspartate ligase